MTTIINGSSPSITFSDGSAQTSATRPFLNRIINGAMVISQRNGTTATTTADDYPVDRFQIANNSAATFSAVQSTTAPAGFNNSFYFNVTAADSSVTGADRTFIRQRIEGYNIADLGFGTASAKTITLSAQVYSSVTGTFGGAILNNAEDRSFAFTYTISSANTWTPISITIAGDTTGTWLTNNSRGMNVLFSLGMGSSLTTAAGSWTAGQFYSATGCTNLISTNGANFYITGVQLEVGSTATSFDYRPYGTELALCQRYFEKSYSTSVVPATATDLGRLIYITGISTGNASAVLASNIFFCVEKRTDPTMVSCDQTGASGKITTFTALAQPTNNVTATYGFGETSTRGSRMATAGNIAGMGCQWTASAEL